MRDRQGKNQTEDPTAGLSEGLTEAERQAADENLTK